MILAAFYFFTWKRRGKSAAPVIRAKSDNEGIAMDIRHGEARVAGPDAIFISYRRSDSADVTGRIYDRLVDHFGRDRVFKDVDSIPLGVDFRKRLGDFVGRCRVLLAVIGKHWLRGDEGIDRPALESARDFVRVEIEAALDRGIPVIPVLVQGARIPREEELPPKMQALAYHNAISIRSDPDFHQDAVRLIKGIELSLGDAIGKADQPGTSGRR